MALTGLQIQKLLPNTNCKECGSNTCLAFAMKLAAKKAELAECPYASEEAKRVLGAASEPPVKCLELGPDRQLKLGGEVVLYRHEKTFVHQTALALNLNDTDPPELIEGTLKTVADYVLERVGEKLRIDMVAITQLGPDARGFAALAAQRLGGGQTPAGPAQRGPCRSGRRRGRRHRQSQRPLRPHPRSRRSALACRQRTRPRPGSDRSGPRRSGRARR